MLVAFPLVITGLIAALVALTDAVVLVEIVLVVIALMGDTGTFADKLWMFLK